MPLATKNGSLIVKDGKVAEGCGCCHKWYCFKQCDSCETGAIPSAVNASITYAIGDGTTTFAMRLVRLQTTDQIANGYCPDFIGRSAIFNPGPGTDPTLAPRITLTIGGVRATYNIDIGLALSFTDSCDAANAVRIEAGANLFSTFRWGLTVGGSVSAGGMLAFGNTFTGPPFVSTGAGLCYGDYPGSGPIPIDTSPSGSPTIYRGTLTLTVTGVE